MEHVRHLAQAAPDYFNKPGSVDWSGVEEVLHAVGVAAQDVVAATWSSLSFRPHPFYESNSQLILIHPRAIIGTVGKKKMFGGRAYDQIDFSAVGRYDLPEDEVRGKYGILSIGFADRSDRLLGRLVWHWSRGTRLPDNTDPYVAGARERERIAAVVSDYCG